MALKCAEFRTTRSDYDNSAGAKHAVRARATKRPRRCVRHERSRCADRFCRRFFRWRWYGRRSARRARACRPAARADSRLSSQNTHKSSQVPGNPGLQVLKGDFSMDLRKLKTLIDLV